jgi:excisionase family DNA binding protein
MVAQATFEPLLSDAEAGELLGLHPKTVQRLARGGELPAIRIGRYWRFRASALNRWIDVHSTGQLARADSERRI